MFAARSNGQTINFRSTASRIRSPEPSMWHASVITASQVTKGTGTDESTSSAQRLNFVSRRAKALTSGPVSTSVVTSGPGAWSGELPRWSEPEAPNRPSRKMRRAAKPQSFASHQPRAGWPRGPSHWRSAPAAPRHRRGVFCRPPAGAPKVLQSFCVCNTSAVGRQMRVAPPLVSGAVDQC